MSRRLGKKPHADIDFTLRRVFGKSSFRYFRQRDSRVLSFSDMAAGRFSEKSSLLPWKAMMSSSKLVCVIRTSTEHRRTAHVLTVDSNVVRVNITLPIRRSLKLTRLSAKACAFSFQL